MADPPRPQYDLEQIKLLLRMRRYTITVNAARTAMALGFDEDDIYDCVASLTPAMLFKSMLSEQRKGMWQDVYYTELDGRLLYVKLQLEPGDEWAIVISFKENLNK